MKKMKKTKRALITGVTGQDGSYLGEFLLDQEYRVYGMVRRSSVEKYDRIEHIRNKLNFVQGDLTDQSSLNEAIKFVQADEVYSLAAQSFVPTSWNQPVFTADVDGLGVTRLLEAVRKHKPGSMPFFVEIANCDLLLPDVHVQRGPQERAWFQRSIMESSARSGTC